MTSKETLSFILEHRCDDVRRLALKGCPEGVDMRYALEQIAGWQTAKRKLPSWAEKEGIIFPPHISMEQCSSEPAAIYKQQLAERLAGDNPQRHVDLTGGFGVDFSFMARGFRHRTYVERQVHLCEIARHNMPLLGLDGVEIVCGDTEEYVRNMPHANSIFVDPARRDGNGGRTFAIADCTPDVAALKDELLARADYVIVKLSPMLDWHKAVADLDCVREVHIVSVRNECRELILVLSASGADAGPTVCCVDCQPSKDGVWHYVTETADADACCVSDNSRTSVEPVADTWLYEPNSSLMKAGCFTMLAEKYSMHQVARNSHLFLSESLVADFPGRIFRIAAVTDFNKKALRRALSSVTKANVAVRNFPLAAAELRRRLKLADGGDTYIFATTLADSRHVLLITKKAPAHC